MVGDNIDGPGGIASVASTYRDAGFLRERGVVYISSFDGAGLPRQVIVMLRAVHGFLKLRRTQAVSLMHIHTASRGSFWRAALLAELARATGVPYILHIHSGEFPIFYKNECKGWMKAVVKRTFQHAASVLCLTPRWQKLLQPIAPSANFSALPNPISILAVPPEPIATSVPRLLFLGRLTEKKGLFDLLQAMPQVLKRCPNVQLVVGGDGDVAAARAVAKQLGVAQAVVFTGWVDGPQKERYLREAAIVVLPSHFEAFGMAILEAMAYGKPVVATRVGGIPDVVVDGVHGSLIAPQDPKALAEALVALLIDQARMTRMGVAGHAHAQTHFAVVKVTDMLGGLYDELLATTKKNLYSVQTR